MCQQLTAIFIAILLACTIVTIDADDECDPNTVGLYLYPGALRSIVVVATQPLIVEAHFVVNRSAEEFILTGVIYSRQFGSDAALTACRSIGCSKFSSLSEVGWGGETCKFQCPDGRYEMKGCSYILQGFACASDAMNLVECVSGAFWPYVDSYGYNNHGLGLICTECGGNSSSY